MPSFLFVATRLVVFCKDFKLSFFKVENYTT